MKHFICAAAFLLFLGVSCKKNNTGADLALLQHTWMIQSINGEALHYVGKPGDFFKFDTNGMLFENTSTEHDTFSYSLTNSGQTLALYQFLNGIKSSTPFDLHIELLTDSTLILHAGIMSPPISVTDSLTR